MYGGKAIVPEDTDILIAGFACDDFSSLNNARKALDDKGESGDTFYAIIAYAFMYEPKMIILENVMNAPWTDEKAKKWKDKPHQTSIQKHLDNVGYFSVFLKMDTKNHYLPHTRNRGYMIAIHRASFPGADWTALEEKCKNMIVTLQHAATVPLEAMLFPSDDPRLEVLDQERKSDNKIVKWEKCKIGHHDYCVDLGLGEKHPITGWKGDGSKEMPDFHRPMPGMTERVADSIDIAHKRNLVRGFDDRNYK
jgi:site-specific DNA-cytosine methylase